MAQTDQAQEGSQDRQSGRDAKIGHDNMAHANGAQDVRGVPGACHRMKTSKKTVRSWGSAPDPGIYRFGANLGDDEDRGDRWPPQSPILAPGTALRLFPNSALSSAQAM